MINLNSNNIEEILKNNEFIGIVEDNIDVNKKDRIKVRIPYLHKQIPLSDIPYSHPKRNANGLDRIIPDIGKVVIVTFPTGDLFFSVYENALHNNINLQRKIEELEGKDYADFISIIYNHNTQIFIDNKTGLNIGHKFQNINLDEKHIALELKDNDSQIFLGSKMADQSAVLGTNFFKFMDAFMNTLVTNAYIGNFQVVASPELLRVKAQYDSLKETFLSKHIFLTDNNLIPTKDVTVDGQRGDNIDNKVISKDINFQVEDITYIPKPYVPNDSYKNNFVTTVNKEDSDNIPTDRPLSDVEKTVINLKRYMRKNNFVINENDYVLNIVGMRSAHKDNGIVTNKFDDSIYVFYNVQGNVVLKKYAATTTPGLEKNTNKLPDNVSMLIYGQYPDYKIKYHKNETGQFGGRKDSEGNILPEHRCLGDSVNHFVNNNGSNYLLPKFFRNLFKKKAIGINIHRSAFKGTSTDVDNYSLGCQVFANYYAHAEFMALCDSQIENAGKTNFTYTLISEADYLKFLDEEPLNENRNVANNTNANNTNTNTINNNTNNTNTIYPNSKSKRLTNQQLLDTAYKFNISPNVLYSVLVNETGGRSAFDNQGRVKILFEGHIFYKLLDKKGFDVESIKNSNQNQFNILYDSYSKRGNAYKLDQYYRLNNAITIDRDSALQSASYGIGQVLGTNYKTCGYKTIDDFVRDMNIGEFKQLEIMMKFITANKKMYKALQQEDFQTFARLYNGPAYATNNYDTKLAATANKFRGQTNLIV